MSNSKDNWLSNELNNNWNKTEDKIEFDLSLFLIRSDVRKQIFGTDPVEELRQMSPQERINRYGRDYSEYL
jgi:hypothetical protein